jgi:Transcriptional activator of acetoin/glycerol metabolism
MGKLPAPSSAWTQYVEQGKSIDSDLSFVILESWERSTQQNVDPYCVKMNHLLEYGSLQERREANRQLLDAASSIMLELHSVLKGGDFIVLLADAQGYILQSYGDPGFEEKAEKLCLAVGSNWHESIRGTNAIGTALASRRGVNVFASEHFCRENHRLTCYAAPIFDPQGELVGVLDISGDYHVHEPHLLGTVVSAARAIENKLLLQNAQKQLITTYLQMSSIMDVVPEGLLFLDPHGFITGINQNGSNILGVSPHECIGRPLDTIFDDAGQWLNELRNSKGILNRTARIERSKGKSHTYSLRMASDKQENISIVASIRNDKAPSSWSGLNLNYSYSFSDIIGGSPEITETKRLARIAARNNSTVLLQGESGTGKEMFAQAIHNASPRSEGPFIPINCGAIPMNLLESELFGYEEGAFTGAKKGGQPGKFEQAHGGTIFLDEISEMPLNFQVGLLRILQEKQVTRVGGAAPIPLDVRIIAGSNKNLESEVEQGNFRLDLYYRLNVLTIDIPALRDRMEDIMPLAHYFLDKLTRNSGISKMAIDPALEEWLENYTWPGNVRELYNIMERAVSFTEKEVIDCQDLPANLRKKTPVSGSNKNVWKLQDREYCTISEVLAKTDGNLSQAAKLLGIGRNTLYRKMQKYSISV